MRKSVSGQSERFNYDANGNLTSRDTGDNIDALLHFNNDLVNARSKSSIKLEGATTPTYSTGRLNQALDLGASGYLAINSAGNFEKGNNTLEFYFKPAWTNDGQVHTLFDYTIKDNYEYRLQVLADGRLKLHFVSLGKDRSFQSEPIDWQANEWYQISVGVNNSSGILIRNGQVLAEKSYCAPLLVCVEVVQATLLNAQNLYVGALLGTGSVASNFAQGTIDELRISSGLRSRQDSIGSFNNPQESVLSRTTSYEYDSSDYLTKITKPSGETVTYAYDANKRLVKRSATNQEDINYTYDGDKINSELRNDKTAIAKYFYDTNGSLLYIAKNGSNYFPVLDGLGSIIALRDSNGATVATYSYDEWGRLLNKTGTVDSPLRYASYWYDETVNLYHLGARWYDPSLYRFISVDPHPGDTDDPATLNEYTYTRNNPVRYTDPDGDYVETGLDIASFIYSLNEFRKKPSAKNAGFMGLDALMIALPIAPGSGSFRAGAKAIRLGDKIAGLRVTKHLVDQAAARKVTAATIAKTVKTGKRYFDPKYGTRIYYSEKTRTAVAQLLKGRDAKKLNTVINKMKKAKSRWK